MSSIPMAPRAASARSISATVKTDSNGDRKPLGQTPSLPSPQFHKTPKNRSFRGNFIIVRRGSNWVRAHLRRHHMTIELHVHYSVDVPWDLDEVEKEIFGRLHRAHMFVERVKEHGFLRDFIVGLEEKLGTTGIDSNTNDQVTGPARLSFDGKTGSFNMSQGRFRDVTYCGEVRAIKSNV